MGLEYLPPFSLNIMVNVGKYYGKCQCKYASPMEYMEITKKTSGFSKFGSKVWSDLQRIMTKRTFVGVPIHG